MYIAIYRYMQQNILYYIAISNKVIDSDIFLTITGSPQYTETNERPLHPGRGAVDRLNLCVRVCGLGLRALMAYVIDDKEFGDIKSRVRVV